MNGGREHIVRGLPHVDVVVGVDRLLLVEAIAAGHLDGAVTDDLVGVHIGRGARAGLVDVDGELIVPLSGRHLPRSLLNGVGHLLVDDLEPGVFGCDRSLDFG